MNMKSPKAKPKELLKSEELALAGLVQQIREPGDGVYALSTVPKKSTETLAQMVMAANASHPKLVDVLKQVADASGLDVTVKTVLLIKPKKGDSK